MLMIMLLLGISLMMLSVLHRFYQTEWRNGQDETAFYQGGCRCGLCTGMGADTGVVPESTERNTVLLPDSTGSGTEELFAAAESQ